MKKYKIIHLEASKGFGGQEIRIVQECRQFINRGHDVEIICQPEAQIIPYIEEHSIPYTTLAMKGSVDISAINKLRKHFKEKKVDIVHTHSSIDSWVGGFAGKLAGVPLMVRSRHVSIPVKNPIVYKFLTDVVITTGNSIREYLIDKLRLKPNKVFSIPTGVNLERFSPELYDSIKTRKELGIAENIPVISIVGVIRHWKGHTFFVDAAKKVLRNHKAVFLIIGESPTHEGRDKISKEISGFGENIKMLGFRKNIPELLNASDILISASIAGEGVSQSILQGLSMQKGLIATDVGPTSEVIIPGKTGVLIPHSDSEAMAEEMIKLIKKPELMKEYGENGRKLVQEKFTIEKMTDSVECVYNQFLTPHAL